MSRPVEISRREARLIIGALFRAENWTETDAHGKRAKAKHILALAQRYRNMADSLSNRLLKASPVTKDAKPPAEKS